MKKYFLFLFLGLLSMQVFTSCKNGSDKNSTTLALLLPDGNINPKWNTDAACITDAVGNTLLEFCNRNPR